MARRHPQIFDAIADGRVHLTGVVLLAPHVTDENIDEVLAAAAHRTKAEIEVLVARLAPKADRPTSLTRIEPGGAPRIALVECGSAGIFAAANGLAERLCEFGR